MKEIWKDIPNYEGIYQISNKGNIKSLWHNKEKIIKPHNDNNGYMQIFLCKNKKKKNIKVHRLVAQTFLPNPNNFPQVNHKDKNRSNNDVNNLEWCNASYNTKYSIARSVIQYTKDGEIVKEWNSITDAIVNSSSIIKCCKGERKSAGGYVWRYKEDGFI